MVLVVDLGACVRGDRRRVGYCFASEAWGGVLVPGIDYTGVRDLFPGCQPEKVVAHARFAGPLRSQLGGWPLSSAMIDPVAFGMKIHRVELHALLARADGPHEVPLNA